jgi:alkaline phosphatase
MKKIILITSLLFLLGCNSSDNSSNDKIKTGNVIFIHPDGTALSNWIGMRMLYYGPDGETNWDKLPNMAIYSPHTKNTLTPSSNAGATMHSYGKKVVYDSYGMDGIEPLTALSGKPMSIMQEAKSKGILTGIVNSGHIVEPGTGAFVASSTSRKNTEEIAMKIVQSGTDLIFSGGEDYLLPKGVKGKFAEGKREDGLNLIKWAEDNGYKVIYSKTELLNISPNVEKILGVFAAKNTFNDVSEEEQKELGLENFNTEAPTIAEMTETAIKFFDNKGKRFFLVVEEEGTDNFGNHTNANGMLEALKRADDAIGVASNFVKKDKNTMLITAADSEAGGMEILSYQELKSDEVIPERDKTGSVYDGLYGTNSIPFLAQPDKFGNRFPFVVVWSTSYDVSGSVIARAEGLNSNLMKGSIENIDIYRFMYATLFGELLKKE